MNAVMTMPTQTRRGRPRKALGPLHEPAAFVDGPNQYQYVGGDPVGAVDPMGLAATTQPTTRPSDVRVLPERESSFAVSETGIARYDARALQWSTAVNALCSKANRSVCTLDLLVQEAFRGYAYACAVGGTLTNGPDASAFLRHYIDGSADPMKLDLARALREGGLGDAPNDELKQAMRFAELNVATLGLRQRFHTEVERSGASQGAWYPVIGSGYYYWSEARIVNVDREGNIAMEWTLHFADNYDFHGNARHIALRDRDLLVLAEEGKAAPFEVYGSAKGTIVWNPASCGANELAKSREAFLGRLRDSAIGRPSVSAKKP